MLIVKVLKFVNSIESQDWLSASDLFVVIECNNQIRRTTVKKNNNKPEWNESFIFHIHEKNIKNSILKISIMEQDNTSKLIKSYKIRVNHDTITKYIIDNILDIEAGNIFEKHNIFHQELLDKIKNISKKNIDNLHELENIQ